MAAASPMYSTQQPTYDENSKKMFKDHFTKWGFSKNLKEPEARAIVRKRQQRSLAGKSSAFQINGGEIDFRRIQSYYERKGLSIDDIVAQRASTKTPPTVRCWTPVPSPLRGPPDLEGLEIMIKHLQDYYQGMCDSKVWVKDSRRRTLNSVNAPTDISTRVSCFESNLNTASKLYEAGASQLAGQALLASQVGIQSIVRADYCLTPLLLLRLLYGRPLPAMP